MYIKYRSKIKLIASTLLLAGVSSCGLLEMEPLNSITDNEMWQTKEDINKALVAAYDALQGCTEQFFVWSEVGGELLYNRDQYDVQEHRMSEGGGYCNWNGVYQVIQRASLIEARAPGAQAIDATFSLKELDYYTSECRVLRDFCYFYLARSFMQFPYINKATLSDEDEYIHPPTGHIAVLDSIRKDLHAAIPLMRPNWNDRDFTDMNLKTGYTKGRMIRPAAYALLADVYLTLAAELESTIHPADDAKDVQNILATGLDKDSCYRAVLHYTDLIINNEDPKYRFIETYQRWFDIFYPGNSSESIFDIQYLRTSTFVDIGWLYGAFINGNTTGSEETSGYSWQQNQTTYTYKQWEGKERAKPLTDDRRGRGRSYISSGFGNIISSGGGSIVWKLAGLRYNEKGEEESKRQSGVTDAVNYPVYRITEMYLMRAEAYARLGRMPEATECLLKVRMRGIPAPDPALRDDAETYLEPSTYIKMDIVEFEDELLQERAAELGAEGKRWFDLVRFAKRQNNLDLIVDRLVETRSFESMRPQWKARLFRPEALYFPISRSELDKNSKLKQNVHYSTDFTAKDEEKDENKD